MKPISIVVLAQMLQILGVSALAADNTNGAFIRKLNPAQVSQHLRQNCGRSGASVSLEQDANVSQAPKWDQLKDPNKQYLCLTGLNGDSLRTLPGAYCGSDFPGETVNWKNPIRIFGLNLPSQGGLSVESNGAYLFQGLEKAANDPQAKPICFVAHSKGAADLLEMVRLVELEPNRAKQEKLRAKIGCLDMIQPAIWGSPLSDGALSPPVLGPNSMSTRVREDYNRRHMATICRGLSRMPNVKPSVYASYTTNLSAIEGLFQGGTHAGQEITQFTKAQCKFNDGFVSVDQTLVPCPSVKHYVHVVQNSDQGAGHLIQGEPFSRAARFLASKSNPPGNRIRSQADRN